MSKTSLQTNNHVCKKTLGGEIDRDDLNLSIVSVPYICNTVPAAPAFGIFQLVRYSRAGGSYYYSIDRVLLLTGQLVKQGFILVRFKSWLRKDYGLHHVLGQPLRNICVINYHRYVLSSSMTYDLSPGFVARVTRQVLPVD